MFTNLLLFANIRSLSSAIYASLFSLSLLHPLTHSQSELDRTLFFSASLPSIYLAIAKMIWISYLGEIKIDSNSIKCCVVGGCMYLCGWLLTMVSLSLIGVLVSMVVRVWQSGRDKTKETRRWIEKEREVYRYK